MSAIGPAQHEAATKQYIPSRTYDTEYPLIDSDPHISRVISYARPMDYFWAAAVGVTSPALMLAFEKFAPSHVGRGGFAPIMRISGAIGVAGAFIFLTQRSSLRFYGVLENKREQEMDMREMVDKVKKGEPLYGKSSLTPYMQGVAARNSRYSATFLHALPWYNFVNHEQHGVDTAKYYLQAEKELEAERNGS